MIVYLLTTPLDFQPGVAARTLLAETLLTMVDLATIAVGLTLITASIMQKVTGVKFPWHRVARFYLTFGILVNIYYYSAEIMK
ncbi:MAG: hypothetical protein ABFR97_10955 [Thermodesulfobacteriota bacterium]